MSDKKKKDKKKKDKKKKKLYCGDKYPTPAGYDGVDSKYGCLKKGVGVGMGIQRRKGLESKTDGKIVRVDRTEMIAVARSLGLIVPDSEDLATILNRVEAQIKKMRV
jgi:hypothetical protein